MVSEDKDAHLMRMNPKRYLFRLISAFVYFFLVSAMIIAWKGEYPPSYFRRLLAAFADTTTLHVPILAVGAMIVVYIMYRLLSRFR